jgi:hypothetical protein
LLAPQLRRPLALLGDGLRDTPMRQMNPYLAPAPAPSYEGPAPSPYGDAADDRGAQVTEMAVEMLRQTRPWVMFLSVMSFIGAAFMFLGGILVMAASALTPAKGPLPGAVLGAIYLPMGLLYIYPAIKMWTYGGAIGRLLTSRASVDLEAALAQQKSFWKFAGIVTIVMMVLYAVAIIGLVIVGVAAAGSAH